MSTASQSIPTAALALGLALLATHCAHSPSPPPPKLAHTLDPRSGAIVRGPPDSKRLALVFTGHEFAEGGDLILSALAARRIQASFFLTGEFLANPRFTPLVRRIIANGHYLGPHSDRHLLYCSWAHERQTLISRAEFRADLKRNISRIRRSGAPPPRFFLPPYEHCNPEIAAWTRELGLTLVNLTPGTRSAADYTEDNSPNHVSSQAILDSIRHRESADPCGLNGFLLLLHVGAGPKRSDPFACRLPELLDFLNQKGYECVRVDTLLGQRPDHSGQRAVRR